MNDEYSKAMDDTRKQLIEARQLINRLNLTCRQTLAFLDGISALDQQRVKQGLQQAIQSVDQFMRV